VADGATHYQYLQKGWAIIVPLSFVIVIVSYYLFPHWFLYPVFLVVNYWLCRFQDSDDDQISMTQSEGRLMRDTKRVNVVFGLLGAWLVGKKVMYAYIIGLLGGHRSWASHGIPFGTIGRMFFYDAILVSFLYTLFGYGVQFFGWKDFVYELYLDIWFPPFIITQYISWQIADIIHKMLDTKWAKGALYTPIKTRR
jgi:hypothetical protein